MYGEKWDPWTGKGLDTNQPTKNFLHGFQDGTIA